jgi:hypothetical protein
MSPSSSSFGRRSIGLTFAFVLASLAISAVLARELYQDGSYYLYRVAEREWFYLVDPAPA